MSPWKNVTSTQCLLHLQLLTEPNQCYLVLLVATAGMTFRGRQAGPQAATPPEPQGGSSRQAHLGKLDNYLGTNM